jgi:hexosaminidase
MKMKLLTYLALASTASLSGLGACGGDDNHSSPDGGPIGTPDAGDASTANDANNTSDANDAGNSGDSMVDGGGDGGSSLAQSIAANTEVHFKVIANVPAATDGGSGTDCPPSAPAGLCLTATITLKNTGAAWNATGWSIYYSSIRKVLEVDSSEFTITHINGDLHKIEPTASFAGFAAGESKTIPIKAEFWMMSETDVMPRFYVVAPGGAPVAITNTDTEDQTAFVDPFTDPLQMRRAPGDQSVIATAATRFADDSAVMDLGAAGVAAEIVPAPASVTAGTGTLDLAAGVTITAAGVDPGAIASVKARLALLGVTVNSTGGAAINVSVDPTNAAFTGKATAEAYTMTVSGTQVTIVGGDAAGAFYGLQSFAGLVPGDTTGGVKVPQMTVTYDAPRYAYRGVQLELARNFLGAAEVLKVLDQMAAYKLNSLHLHLSDDEGWRVEIAGLPELTTVGASRCADLTEKTCLIPELGSGPTNMTSGTGYLTHADFVSILQAAKARYIDVIPEFDMPGHARAAVKAMQTRTDTTYSLTDPQDMSSYESIQYYDDNAINACLESSYAFVAKVMDGVSAMYTEAGATLHTWHVGADEVGAGAWTKSPACQMLFMAGTVPSADYLQGYFIGRVNALAKARGFGIRGWSDGLRKAVASPDGGAPGSAWLDPATDLAGNAVSANWWGTLFWWDNRAYELADHGYKVILTSPDFLYLDHPYEADPKERGYYWATRYTSVRKLFSYIPGNLPENAKLTKDRMGGDYTAVFQPTASSPTPVVVNSPQNIIGMEAAQWGETMRTVDELEYMVFPRLLAMAERAWHRAGWEPADISGTTWDVAIDMAALATDWQRFANVLGHKELPKLDKQSVHYRVDVPGGQVMTGALRASATFPGMTIEYQDATGNWVTYNGASPPAVTSTQIRVKSSNGRTGRAVTVP